MAARKKLYCRKCNYTFYLKGDKDEIPFRCPYCSKEGTVAEVRHILETL